MMGTSGLDHVVVIGGSVAGLAAAAAVSSRAGRVTVLERHARAAGSERSIVRHGAFPHVLLAGGAAALERLAPGITDDLVARGALDPVAAGGRCHWWAAGAVRRTIPDLGVGVPMCSRDLVEARLRAHVAGLPNVELQGATVVRGLRSSGRAVTGVDVDHIGGPATLDADLVVDASGRGSRAASWIEAVVGAAPTVGEVGVDLTYVSVDVQRGPSDLDGAVFAIVQNTPTCARIGVALPAEGDRWKIVVGGYFGDAAVPTREGVLAFARSLPDPAIAGLLEGAWLTEAARCRFPSSRRHHFERMRSFPAGFCVIGDAVASFNPIYGQGMSAAVLQAEQLAHCLDRVGAVPRLGRAVAKATAQVVDNPWRIATGADFIYDATCGHRSPGTDRVNRYLEKVMVAAAHDEVVDLALARVQHLLAPPHTLMAPGTIRRVRRVVQRARPQAGAPAPLPVATATPTPPPPAVPRGR